MALIEARDLVKSFDSRRVVDGLSLSIEAGEIMGFLGPNGAGKTTTVRMMAGLIAPDSGVTILDGIKVRANEVEIHRRTGLLTETPGFYARLSAWDNLLYFGGFYPGIRVKDRAEETLRQMNLWDRKNDLVGGFSKGMKQKLALCRALLHEPPVVFLDEPTSGLDPEARVEVRELILKLKAAKRAVFLCTHYLDEAQSLCDRVAVFRSTLLAIDTPDSLRERFFSRRLFAECLTLPDNILEKLQNSRVVLNPVRDGLTLSFTPADFGGGRYTALRELLDSGCQVVSYREEEHSLEEVYLTLMQEAGHE